MREFDRFDAVVNLFESWNIPLSGNTLLWEASESGREIRGDPKTSPDWFKQELQEYLAKDQSPEPLRENILDFVRDVAARYKGRLTSFKMFNEPLHGDEYRGIFPNIWEDVFEVIRKADPEVELFINDYEISSSDQGQCYLDLIQNFNFSCIGVQAHQKAGFVADIIHG